MLLCIFYVFNNTVSFDYVSVVVHKFLIVFTAGVYRCIIMCLIKLQLFQDAKMPITGSNYVEVSQYILYILYYIHSLTVGKRS